MSAGFSQWGGWAATVVVGGFGALSTYLASRRAAQPATMAAEADLQQSINDGFSRLMLERKKIDDERDLIWRGLIEDLRGDVRNLTQHVESLERLLRENGLGHVIPPRPVKGEPQALIMLEGGKS
jgi:hypothetical protein